MENEFKVESIIKKEERESLYKIMFIGLSTYNRILNENRELMKTNSFDEIKTRLLSFVIKRQFEDDMLSLDFPYKVEFKKTNNFGSRVVFLKNNKSKIQINKIPKNNKLYNSNKPSSYMLKEAKSNSYYTRELTFFVDANDEIGIKENERVYIILGYRIKGNQLEYLRFHIPDEHMNNSIDYFDGINEYNDMINGNNNEVYEEKIIALKGEALKLIEIK
ncbi:hypothetical protein I3900191A7_14470 [Clostridium baratii]|uniref:hypothetical protein n=1 Tax=Clostridium baratii TaxID=1561 RepID=UPI0036F42607